MNHCMFKNRRQRTKPGKNDGPFATVAAAREAVRALLKTRKEQRRVRVTLRGETYYLDTPLTFGPEDSGTEKAPVVYAAAAGEKVVLSGGRQLKGGRWGEVRRMIPLTGKGTAPGMMLEGFERSAAALRLPP